jgi:hypothetical protein
VDVLKTRRLRVRPLHWGIHYSPLSRVCGSTNCPLSAESGLQWLPGLPTAFHSLGTMVLIDANVLNNVPSILGKYSPPVCIGLQFLRRPPKGAAAVALLKEDVVSFNFLERLACERYGPSAVRYKAPKCTTMYFAG